MRTLQLFFVLIITIAANSGPPRPAAPAIDRAPFVFTAAGDYGTSADATATLDLIARSGASFNLALGDLSYSAELSETAWCDYVKSRVGTAFRFQLVPGNHEEDFAGNGHIRNFARCLPDRMNSTGDYPTEYYFDYGGLARFIVLSPDLTVDGEHYFYGEANSHYTWAANAIDGARAAKIPWVIVGMHKNCLSVGAYYCNIYQELMSLLVEKKVDLVLQAHDHTYQRTRQLATGPRCSIVEVDSFNASCVADDGEDGVYLKGAGAVFVITGAAGEALFEINPGDPEAGYFATWMGLNANPRKGFVKVRVSNTELAAEFIGSTATSNFTDTFTIKRQFVLSLPVVYRFPPPGR